jgi:hypothetical protein
MQPAPITLPLNCTRCQGAVTIEFDWSTRQSGAVEEGRWSCPYCQALQRLGAIGRVVSVEKRADDPDPGAGDTKPPG